MPETFKDLNYYYTIIIIIIKNPLGVFSGMKTCENISLETRMDLQL